ncbi:hypothetical protein ACTFIU_005806 [Dictyostelium citrinum]
MVESKKRVNQSLSKPKKPIKQIKLGKNNKITKNVKKEIEQPIIEEQEQIEQEQEENKTELEEEEEEEEDKITFNNNNDDQEEEKEEEEEDNDKDDFEINKNEEEEEEVEIKSKEPKGKTNEQLLCERFIKTMAASYAQQLKGKNSTGSTLRGLYFESINQLKHEGIRELLFKPQSWHKFYRIVRAILKSKKDNDIEDIEIKETVEEDDDEEDEDDEDEENNKSEEEEEISNKIFKNLLSYEVISGRESLIQQLKDNQPEELQHLYKQSISLNQSDKYSIIINSFFITSKLSPSQLLHKFIMYSLTLNNVTNEIIDMLNTIIDLSDINDKESNSSIYKSLRQFLSISILDNLKNNSCSSKNNSIDNDTSMIKSYVKLATNLFKFSLLNSSIQFIESDYSAIKLLLGKSITFLPKLVSMMTSFDFSQDQFIQQQQQQSPSNKNNINNISIFLNQFIQESKLSNPPTNSISYLKSRILCERGILVLTKLKDPLLTKLKISSATLPVPESLLNFFKEKQGQSLLVKTHKSMDDTQAIRLLKLNNLLEILNKIEEIENQQQQQQQDDDQENDYIEDHYVINKQGNSDENVDENGDEEIEEQIDSMEGTKSLLDFLDEDDLKSDEDDE